MKEFLYIFLIGIIFHTSSVKCQSFTGTVFTDSVVHTMRGGIGASWHAISNIGSLENEKYKYPVREENPLGSAWGGNPPLQDKKAWQQLCNHARWLGLDFIRVELMMKMYEPQKGKFEWDSDDMQALYRILDCCQQIGTDVFLQQMTMNIDWNNYPGVHPLLSAPLSLDDYAEGIVSLLEHLTIVKKYTCIKYFCITNEPPGGPWGYWWSNGPDDAPFSPALKRVHEELVKRNITIQLSGPDWTSLPPFNEEKLTFDPYIGAYDIHSYDGIDDKGAKTVQQWAQWAHSKDKPFFISEFGNMKMGWGRDNPGPKSPAAALSNAHDMITALSAGTDGMNRWSFTNRSDMDGQWQLVRTWDIQNKEYLKNVIPENTAYYGFAMFTRFIAKNASILKTSYSAPADLSVSMISLRNPDGNLVFIILNQSDENKDGTIMIKSKSNIDKLYKYLYNEKIPPEGEYALNPIDTIIKVSTICLLLEKRSITVFSTKLLNNSDWGTIK
ncbi:MAG: cellulase family glycosylhydrolase [Bacteroidia bacterium]|nr:cellulase family glycosylhydrolase [Bacteroidia bacterium]